MTRDAWAKGRGDLAIYMYFKFIYLFFTDGVVQFPIAFAQAWPTPRRSTSPWARTGSWCSRARARRRSTSPPSSRTRPSSIRPPGACVHGLPYGCVCMFVVRSWTLPAPRLFASRAACFPHPDDTKNRTMPKTPSSTARRPSRSRRSRSRAATGPTSRRPRSPACPPSSGTYARVCIGAPPFVCVYAWQQPVCVVIDDSI